jgi:hypothetical protein
VVRNLEAGACPYTGVEPIVHRLVEVEDALTYRAREVVVTLHPRFEANTGPLLDLGEESVTGEQTKVTIHSGQTYMRKVLAHLHVHPLCGRVAVRAPDDGQDEPPLLGEPHPALSEICSERGIGP